MKKKSHVVRNTILALLAVLLLAGGALVRRGYVTYRQVTSETSVVEAATPYFSSSSYTSFKDLNENFVNAVVAVEDQRFFRRYGFDWVALCRALLNNLEAGSIVEGASTISQQIAKNLYFSDTPRGIEEKVAEVFIMYDLEKTYSKASLLALYVSMNYYGDGCWGIASAAEGYYGVTPAELDLAQSAMLAGIPNAPSAYQLSTGYDLAMQRMKKVLTRMVEEDYITQEEMDAALQEDMHPVS
jgi:monofunctional glycosyltransferase